MFIRKMRSIYSSRCGTAMSTFFQTAKLRNIGFVRSRSAKSGRNWSEEYNRRKPKKERILLAKLEGVKIIDMKDGEVTKISYEGEVYTKVETEAMSGDIIRYKGDYVDTPSNDFFKVIGDQYEDNVGSTLRIDGWGGHHKYTAFSKYKNQVNIEDRVSALESRVDAMEKVEEENQPVQAGDIIRITDGLGKRNGEA